MKVLIKFNHLGDAPVYFLPIQDVLYASINKNPDEIGVIVMLNTNTNKLSRKLIPCLSEKHAVLIKDQIDGLIAMDELTLEVEVDPNDSMLKRDNIEDATTHNVKRKTKLSIKPKDYGVDLSIVIPK
ncbi:MAG: hypothetical protein OQK82_07975 [Candidatus Pacearchaeota archaeon]|nr:hypothetical protein [Candidatus Pacearchaeota archaeon]